MTTHIAQRTELFYYTLIGGIATLIDWSLFAITTNGLGLHYQFSLALSLLCAGSFHYISNKIITFRCTSKKIASQLTLYIVVSLISLSLSMGIMAVLVRLFAINVVFLRMATTGIMLIPNYLLHKNVTFKKRHLDPGLFP